MDWMGLDGLDGLDSLDGLDGLDWPGLDATTGPSSKKTHKTRPPNHTGNTATGPRCDWCGLAGLRSLPRPQARCNRLDDAVAVCLCTHKSSSSLHRAAAPCHSTVCSAPCATIVSCNVVVLPWVPEMSRESTSMSPHTCCQHERRTPSHARYDSCIHYAAG